MGNESSKSVTPNKDSQKIKEAGKSFPRTKINKLSQLKRADQIAFWRVSLPVWHHGIVVDVDAEDGKILLRHYSNTATEFVKDKCKIKASIREEWVEVNCLWDHLYRVDSPPEMCLSPDEVMRRTEERLGESEYHAFTNNCEHFARWCKIGEDRSIQVEDMQKELMAFGAELGGKILKSVSQDTLELLLKQGRKRVVVKAGAEVAGAAIIVGVEITEFAKIVSRTWEQFENGKLTSQECLNVIANDLGKFSASTIGAIVGDILGQMLIPVPFLGGILGGFLGLLVGKITGPWIGRIFAMIVETAIVLYTKNNEGQ